MDPYTHVLVDGHGDASQWSPDLAERLSRDIAAAAGMTIFAGPTVIENGPLIVAMTLIAESHIALHLDTRQAYAWVDVFSCKAVPPEVVGVIIHGLGLHHLQVHRWRRTTLP